MIERKEIGDSSRGAAVYEPCPIKPKRLRRTREQLRFVDQQIIEVLSAEHPVTLRQLYYKLVSRQVIEKTETAYKALSRQLVDLRVEGDVPFDWVADNTRWMRIPKMFAGPHDAIARTAQSYRRSYWAEADSYVEVWVEKDSVAGVVLEETAPWGVPLMAARGFASVTFLHSAASAIKEQHCPAFLYYVGDHDPSGVAIDRNIEQQIRKFAPKIELHFERLAVLPEQIEQWHLPTRPTKRSDARAKNFKGGSVEVEAIEPDQLRALVREAIERHVDPHAFAVMQAAEQSEREALMSIAEQWEGS